MVQKIYSWGVIWVPSIPRQAGHLSEKKLQLSCPAYEDVRVLGDYRDPTQPWIL